MKATAYANVNIALIKYWGKRDEDLLLPQNDSVSITLADYGSTTTVEFAPQYQQDQFELNDIVYETGEELARVSRHLDLVRDMAGIQLRARVKGKNAVLTAAGLASSASGFAALSAAASKAARLELNLQQLSILARRGSGSATRSIYGGFVQWQKGKQKDGQDSHAVQWQPETYWPDLRVLITIIDTSVKAVASRAGMKQTVATSPFYSEWLDTANKDIKQIQSAISAKNFSLLGSVTEKNCLKMHSLMLTTDPALIYWQPGTVAVMHAVHRLRERGVPCYFTIDAGSQVKVLCLQQHLETILSELKTMKDVMDIIPCHLGRGIDYLESHLF